MKKLLSVIAAAALAMTSFAAFATTAAAFSADKEVYDITFSANGNTRTVENVTLPHTFSCDYQRENGELDYIIRGLYGWDEGCCDCNANPTVSGSSYVTAGRLNGNSHYITVNEAFDGEVTASGTYEVPVLHYDEIFDEWDTRMDFRDYTLTITCSAPKTAISTEWEWLGDFGSNTDPDDKASLWLLGVTPGTEAVTSVGIKVKDNNNVWHSSTDTYTTPAISNGTVIFGVVVNRSALDLYGIGSVVNNTDLVKNLVY